MSRINFKKYQGTGNDFVIVEGPIALNQDQIQSICDRNFGVGADGLIVLTPSEQRDFDMHYYNADGSSSFCGNGSRCSVLYAKHHGWIQTECEFSSNDGLHSARIDGNWIELAMHNVKEPSLANEHYLLNTGSPHYIEFRKDIDQINVDKEGASIRYSEEFKEDGINVNFVQLTTDGLSMRTYERGVEAETLSCGTGVTAAALAFAHKEGDNQLKQVVVQTPGGTLEVKFNWGSNGFEDIYLCGPAQYVFQGEIDI